ncbi:hypothetical protein FQ087_13595 [Sporosarcina sp. ANT_H38]|uniref:hypothetical protein n=1 Tax=Sporosarcina sp. ANT_H38 TaxID=2597358 RepID=UPI0011F2A842|nr:hypothetical protein [Sporosarcina sp. ANT_H38]KAA0955631.1 hypothetical protein FQ087_13595 [Sporosarcina sp. ANT_H38]
MFKKAIPLVLMSGLVLTACANNDAVPENNETPMENVEDRTKDMTPEVNDGQTGPDMDGLENEGDLNGTGVDNGVIKDDSGVTPNEDVINDENMDTPNEIIIDKDLDQNKTNENNR